MGQEALPEGCKESGVPLRRTGGVRRPSWRTGRGQTTLQWGREGSGGPAGGRKAFGWAGWVGRSYQKVGGYSGGPGGCRDVFQESQEDLEGPPGGPKLV